MLVLIMSPLLSSCILIDNQDYPSGWPAVEPASLGQCPNLVGRFRNSGIKDSPEIQDITLTSAFLCWSPDYSCEKEMDYAGYLYAEIKQLDSDTLTFSGLNLNLSITKTRDFILNRENSWTSWALLVAGEDVSGYKCASGGLQLKQDSFAMEPGSFLFGTDTREFFNANNRDLIMKKSVGSYGFILGIPLYSHHRHWFRWSPRD